MIAAFNQNNIAMWRALDHAKKILALGKKDLEVFGIETITNDKGNNVTVTKNESEAKKKKAYDVPDRLVFEVKDFLDKTEKDKKLTEAQFHVYEALFTEEKLADNPDKEAKDPEKKKA